MKKLSNFTRKFLANIYQNIYSQNMGTLFIKNEKSHVRYSVMNFNDVTFLSEIDLGAFFNTCLK